jgi:hypothetical protein
LSELADDAVERTVPKRKASHLNAHDVMRSRAGIGEQHRVDVETGYDE